MRKALKKASYLDISDREFGKRVNRSKKALESCSLCGNNCKVNRFKKLGICGIGSELKVSSVNLHHGEEPPISGKKGSGTVFLTGCSLSCVFCQNYPITQLKYGVAMSAPRLGAKMVELEERGAHNINFVGPTHQVPQIIEAVFAAKKMGLKIPLVYNSSGYDSIECLKLMDGIVDIYLPDFKYYSDIEARKYSGAREYKRTALDAIKEMFRQVGNLKMNAKGSAKRGVMIRHLVLPRGLAGTEKIFALVKKNLPTSIYISIMGQYFPAYRASECGLKTRVKEKEYSRAIKSLLDLGFTNIFRQKEIEESVFLPKIEL